MYAIMSQDIHAGTETLVSRNIYPNEEDAELAASRIATIVSDFTEVRPFESLLGEKITGYYVFESNGLPSGVYFVRELNVVGREYVHA